MKTDKNNVTSKINEKLFEAPEGRVTGKIVWINDLYEFVSNGAFMALKKIEEKTDCYEMSGFMFGYMELKGTFISFDFKKLKKPFITKVEKRSSKRESAIINLNTPVWLPWLVLIAINENTTILEFFMYQTKVLGSVLIRPQNSAIYYLIRPMKIEMDELTTGAYKLTQYQIRQIEKFERKLKNDKQ